MRKLSEAFSAMAGAAPISTASAATETIAYRRFMVRPPSPGSLFADRKYSISSIPTPVGRAEVSLKPHTIAGWPRAARHLPGAPRMVRDRSVAPDRACDRLPRTRFPTARRHDRRRRRTRLAWKGAGWIG